jgi:hypothetical protein
MDGRAIIPSELYEDSFQSICSAPIAEAAKLGWLDLLIPSAISL